MGDRGVRGGFYGQPDNFGNNLHGIVGDPLGRDGNAHIPPQITRAPVLIPGRVIYKPVVVSSKPTITTTTTTISTEEGDAGILKRHEYAFYIVHLIIILALLFLLFRIAFFRIKRKTRELASRFGSWLTNKNNSSSSSNNHRN